MEKELTHEELERIANFEGNQSELMLQRLSSAKIFNQIVDLWETRLQVDWKYGGKNTNISPDETSVLEINKKSFYLPKNREEIEAELQRRLDNAMVSTPVRIERDINADTECIPTELILQSGKRASTEQMSIVEAHEKGHLIRTYSGMYYEMIFHEGFDFSLDIIKREVVRNLGPEKKSPLADPNQAAEDLENATAQMYWYISQPAELCERMSQLKNYFGMSGTEEFTKTHLDYARENYVTDTGMDNNMTLFFECITPDSEADFVKLMNTVGI